MEGLNDSPAFISALADLVLRKVGVKVSGLVAQPLLAVQGAYRTGKSACATTASPAMPVVIGEMFEQDFVMS